MTTLNWLLTFAITWCCKFCVGIIHYKKNFHKKIKLTRTGKDLRRSVVQPPAQKRPWIQTALLWSLSCYLPKPSKDIKSTTSVGNLCQWLTILRMHNFQCRRLIISLHMRFSLLTHGIITSYLMKCHWEAQRSSEVVSSGLSYQYFLFPP